MNEMKKAIFYADAHFDKQSDEALQVMYDYIDDNSDDVKFICDLGDGIDNPYMSTFPVDPYDVTPAQDEFDMYADHLKTLQDLSPKSHKYLMAGNHDKARLNNAKNLNRGIASLRNLQYESVLSEAMKEAGITSAQGKKFHFCDRQEDIKLTPSNIVTIMHGDPRLNPYIKGGVTGIRRTAEMYPNGNWLIMGHGHWYQFNPRMYDDKAAIMIGCMADVEKMKEAYMNHHPYSNGFGVMHYDPRADKAFWEYKEIK